MTFYADSRDSVAAFARAIRNIPAQNQPAFSAAILSMGLMRTHWWLHLAVWLGCRFRGGEPYDRWLMLFKRYPDVAGQVVRGTAQWAETGRDSYDATSVGGYSQVEINQIEGLIDRVKT